jgi:hypothetical protein
MAGWTTLVYILFPVPLISLLLLCLPLPGSVGKKIRKVILMLLDKILFHPLISGFNMYQICILLSTFLFMVACYETGRTTTKLNEAKNVLMDMKEERLRCQKWRSERNFWISFMSLMLWLVLFRVTAMTKEITVLDDSLGREKKKMK